MQDSEADRLYGKARRTTRADPQESDDFPSRSEAGPSVPESEEEGGNVDAIFAGVSDDEDLEEGGYDSEKEGEDPQGVSKAVREALGIKRRGGRRTGEVVDEAVPESQYNLSAGEHLPWPPPPLDSPSTIPVSWALPNIVNNSSSKKM